MQQFYYFWMANRIFHCLIKEKKLGKQTYQQRTLMETAEKESAKGLLQEEQTKYVLKKGDSLEPSPYRAEFAWIRQNDPTM